jgi:hypothetical protein
MVILRRRIALLRSWSHSEAWKAPGGSAYEGFVNPLSTCIHVLLLMSLSLLPCLE